MRGGGLAGLVTTTTADSEALAPKDAEALRARVEGSGLLQLPARSADPTRYPDAFDYAVTVEDAGLTQQVSLTEDALPPAIRSLISWVDAVPGHQDTVGPAGG